MGAMEEIRHIVVLMLENQSFDRMLGYLKLDDPNEKADGLAGTETNPMSPPGDMTLVPVGKISAPAAYVTDPSPGHEFEDVNQQLFGERNPQSFGTPVNNGFVLNYSWQIGHDGRRIDPLAQVIMQCLDPALVPVISTLAKNFVVCDHWHASVPGPTWPNRFFVHAATSNGLCESPTTTDMMGAEFWGTKYRMRTIYENLLDHGHTWKIYFDDQPQSFALRNLHRHLDLFQRREDAFARDVAQATLPAYALIEPQYFDVLGNPANDQHPPHDIREGERLIAWVYDTLRSNPEVWRQTLLVLLYDEHGGFYDHVAPPAAVAPDDTSQSAPVFKFDRLGLRVPALLISPWVGRGKVDHTVYDHTSLLATVKRLFGLPAFLTRRDAAAKTFEGNFLANARSPSDMPSNLSALVNRTPTAIIAPDQRALSGHQRSMLALASVLAGPQSEHDAAQEVDARVRGFLNEPQA